MKAWPSFPSFLVALAAACAGAAHGADTTTQTPATGGVGNCESLRAQIEAKIAAAGVARFAVLTVDANAPAEGQVVGSCELGSRKIVYQREGAAPGAAGAARPAAAGEEPILTECKDGTVSLGGDCRK